MKKLIIIAMMLFIFSTGILLFVTTAHAAPFIYDESISGDLGASLPAPTVFPFDIGVNSVLGTTLVSGQLYVDWDNFTYSIPFGTQLTQVSYAFSDVSVDSAGGGIAYSFFALGNGNQYPPNPSPYNLIYIDFLGASPVSLLGADLPLGPGTYALYEVQKGGIWSVSYQWDFTVQPIPEPTTMLLLGSGLLGLWGAKKKFKK